MKATCWIETLILKSRSSQDKSFSSIDGTVREEPSCFYKDSDQPGGSPAINSKLMNAVVVFISRSLNLHTVIMDSIKMQSNFVSGLGEALSTSKSGTEYCFLQRLWLSQYLLS